MRHGETMAMLFVSCVVRWSSWLFVAVCAYRVNCALYAGLSLFGVVGYTFSLGLTLVLGSTLGKGLNLV